MRRQLLVNACLVALALGTLGVVWATREAPTSSELAARKDKLLPSWQKDKVTRIVLERPGVTLELVRDNASGVEGDFRIARPWQERADIASVSALLGSLELASALRSAAEVPLDKAGLTSPALLIRLEMAGRTQSIALGGPAPAPAGARYARVTTASGESQLYTLSQGLVSELDLPFDKFRETRLLEYGRSDLAKLRIASPTGELELERKDGVFFTKTKPPATGGKSGSELADRDASEHMLAALAQLSTEQFVEPEQARSAFGPSSVRVTLELQGGKAPPVALTFGGSCPKSPEQILVLREQAGRGARAGCLSGDLLQPFRVTAEQLTSKAPFSARLDEVEELQLARGGVRLDLARKERGFVLRAPSSQDLPLDVGNQRIAALLGVATERSAQPPSELGLEPVAGEVTLRLTSDAARSERVELGRTRPDGSLCLRRSIDSVVLCVDAVAARAFDPDARLLKSLELPAFAPSELVAFELQTPELRQRLRRDQDGSYTVEEPKGFRHDGALVADVVQALGTLRAERWASVDDDGTRGLAAPRLRAVVELAGGAKRELAVGSETPGGYFAKLSPDPGVFVLARSTLAELGAPLVDRSLVPLAEAATTRVELEAGGRRATLERRGEGWALTGGAAGVSEARVTQLAETLGSLRAERTLHLGPPQPAEGFAKPSLAVTWSDAQGKRARLQLGARTRGADGVFFVLARLDSVDATFALSDDTARALQDF